MFFSRCCVNKPSLPLPSLATCPGVVANDTSVPTGAYICARRWRAERKLRANGLLRQASRMTRLSRLPECARR
jgi:hypothetical protein